MVRQVLCAFAASALLASGARAAAEDQAVRAFAALRSDPRGDASARVRELLDLLDADGLHNLGTVALFDLAASDRAGVGEAAARELEKRAQDGGVALSLLLRAPWSKTASPAMAVKLARAHLERALVISPPEEGSAFASMDARAPSPTPASAMDTEAPQTVSAAQKLALAELTLARTLLASVPAGDEVAGEAREVAALAGLAAGDLDFAQAQFEAAARAPVKGEEAKARHERAVLQIARLAYSKGDDARAQSYYSRVSREAPEWLDALFESSWSHFRKGEDEKALGNLLTLHAPFFRGRYYPESYVLKALVLYENCRYADARRTLAEFEARHRPLHDGLAGALERMGSAQAAVDLLARGKEALASFPESARDEVARIASAPELQVGISQVVQIAQELDSIDRRPATFARSLLAQAALPRLREARLDLIQSVGDRVRSRVAMERAELRELLGQALRLDFEISGREKELAASPAAGSPAASERRAPLQVDEDELLWPFEGEYWRDELGSYQIQLGRRCPRPRGVSPQEAQTAPKERVPAAMAEPGSAAR
jgi:hypothetical protein